MRLSDRFYMVNVESVSDGLGGSIKTPKDTIEPKPCSAVKTTKEWVQKQYGLEISEPLVLLTFETLEDDEYIKYLDEYYVVVKGITPKYKRTRYYALSKVVF